MSIYYPPTQNAIQKTLDAQLLEGITASMTLNNVVGIANEPGVCVVDFVDTNNLETPTKREYIAFTGVSGNTLTGLTRNADGGGTDQDHAVGAIVQFPSDILQQKAIIDGLLETVDTDGALDTTKVVDLTTAQTLTNKTLVQKVAAYAPEGAGTTTIDLSTGNIHTVTMPAATQTLAISNGTTGQCFLVEINNVTSQGALTWFATIRWVDGSAPTLTGTNGKRDVFGFRITDSGTYDGYVVGQNI